MKTQFKKGMSWRDENGFYTWQENKYPSVTTVLGPHSEFLWVHLIEIEKIVNELSARIDTGGMWQMWIENEGEWTHEFVKPQQAIRDGKHISKAGLRYLKECANRGSLIHELITDYASGAEGDHIEGRVEELIMLNSYSCKIDDVLPFAHSLWNWLDVKRPTVVMSEVPVFNETIGYAGTCDGVMYLDGKLLCFDAKTQATYSAKRSHFAQIGAYANSEFVAHEEFPLDMPTVELCGILYVTPEQTGMRLVDNYQMYYEDLFLPALKAFNTHKSGKMPTGQTEWVKHEKEIREG